MNPPDREGGPPFDRPPPESTWSSVQLLNTSVLISSFGEDEDGEIYVVDLGGDVYRMEPSVTLSPPSGRYSTTQDADLVISIYETGLQIDEILLGVGDRRPVDASYYCTERGRMAHGGVTIRCPGFLSRLGAGNHDIRVRVRARDGRELTAGVRWQVQSTRAR